jgi:hypothetical protein
MRFLALAVIVSVSGCSTLFPSGSDSKSSGQTTGCATSATKHIAPGGYYVNGNSVCTAKGAVHLFHGVDRPSLEFSTNGRNLSPQDFALMASWNANVVRIALNQDFWLAASPYYTAAYPVLVDNTVHWAEDAGMDVILDLHWSDQGMIGSCSPTGNCQQVMADSNSITFWSEIAAKYKDDGRVLFELYNEPHNLDWAVWRSGGPSGTGWTVAGMQQMYDAVRAAGADNLVIAGGLDFAYDLTGVVGSGHLKGYNIMYATHPYNNATEKLPGNWDQYWGFLTATDPVIVTEFGDSNASCPTDYSSQLIDFADMHKASWTAWAWYVGGCKFPSLITDWNGTPSEVGAVVKTALAKYTDPAPGGKRNGGGELTFDAGVDASGAAPDAPDGGPAAAPDATDDTVDTGAI